ncbi:glutamine-hydrolyzing carbamoyl-phosphate synthase small subunit [bacterium]|nr:glutamine-hydrolyzing carbamoyl-phosphate synthase small subunit [bacterium]
MEAWIALETGRVFRGRMLGAPDAAGGEVVFHTGMTGYQEILTDPSYAGQVVCFTAAHIGNYGIHGDDHESRRIHPAAVVIRDFCRRTFHRRRETSLDQVLRQAGVPAIAGVDTRALTIALRDEGTCRGWVGVGDPDELVAKARALPPIAEVDWVRRVTTERPYTFPVTPAVADPCEVAVLDCGVKKSILGRLVAEGCRVRVFPADTPAAALLAGPTEGVFLSNGPGDPASQEGLVAKVRELLDADVPVFGICLGHQLLARALGAETTRLPFGHHGANHPVQNLATGRVEITSQNHNYAVPRESLDPAMARATHVSLNDGSVEGLEAVASCAYSVQYHPEAAPGPSDSLYLFERFRDEMLARRSDRDEGRDDNLEMKRHAAAD